MVKSVCIIGAGPSGLAAAKSLLHNAPAGTFNVVLYDSQATIGGRWPISPADIRRQTYCPSRTAELSRHSMQFSDLAWEPGAPQFPRAWMVGRYLKRYFDLFLKDRPDLELELDMTVKKVERADDERWMVHVNSAFLTSRTPTSQTRKFDYLLVASGYFGGPIISERYTVAASVPVIHSSRYRDLKSLLGNQPPKGGKILVVDGKSSSGVEIAGIIASHLSSAIHSLDSDSRIANAKAYSVHHVVSKPIWVSPLYTTPEPTFFAPPFLPHDFSTYNVSARKSKAGLSQGHVTEEASAETHAKFEMLLGDQSEFSPLMWHGPEAKQQPPRLALSDWYCELVRSGTITLSRGTVEKIQGNVATLSPGASRIGDVAAVVLATGFDASTALRFLPEETLEKLSQSPEHNNLPQALAFLPSHHPDVPRLGFVGFDSNPYWGVVQLQARFLTKLWSGEPSQAMTRAFEADASIDRTLHLRGDPQVPQILTGDHLDIMSQLAAALSIDPSASIMPPSPTLSANNRPLDMFTPSRYVSPDDDAISKQEAQKSLEQTRDVTVKALTTPRFVAYAVFRSLLGRWRLQRKVTSRSSSHPSGMFVGTADFFLRKQTSEGSQCDRDSDEDGGVNLEYLYFEEGEFKTDNGLAFRATRHYIWRYNAKRDVLSQWFTRTHDVRRAHNLFHEVEFIPRPAHSADADDNPAAGVGVDPGDMLGGRGWRAKAGHLCVNDYYDVKYEFEFKGVELDTWAIEYTVNGPKKDYTIQGIYERE